MTHATVKPGTVRLHSELLNCDVVSTVYYTAKCGCGYVGPHRDIHAQAARDARDHNKAKHRQRPAS